MVNVHWLKKPVAEQIQEFVADASLAIDVGDLMYHTGDDAKPASSQTDQTSEALNQELFARNFVGVANSARLSTQTTAGVVRVQTDGLYEFTCTSSTFEIGDMVGADEAASGTALEDQSVKKVTDARYAIGTVIQRYASAATKVWVRLKSAISSDVATKQQAEDSDGGTVTQITSDSTGVTLSKMSGQITTFALVLATTVDTTFTVTNTKVLATDVVVCNVGSYSGTADGIPVANVVAVAAGSFDINIRNTGAVTLDALAVVNFKVLRGHSI